jgi:feruloyl esterase
MSASPGKSGGEGGGQGTNVTLHEATKADPILRSSVGQPAGPPTGADPASRCIRIAYSDQSTIKDAQTQIIDAAVQPAKAGSPAVCVVNGYIAHQIGFRIWLPLETWNGKFMQTGCGGRCGDLLPGACEYQSTRGYACVASNLGHRGTTYDDLWAVDDIPAQIDFGFRATHVATIVGKTITTAFYGQPPKHAYYVGASTGGRQGLVAVQRFPADYDGVIAGEPAMNAPGKINGPAWAPLDQATQGLFKDGKALIDAADIRMVHRAVLARCDGDDGLKDGIITDPRTCAFKPSDIRCKAAKTPDCLTPEQVAAVASVYAAGPQPGSELGWIGAYVAEDGTLGRYAKHAAVTNQYPYTWVFDDAANPDIRAFKAAGGKFILYQGWADEAVFPLKPVDYYETVERLMGGRAATQDFFRFFIIPGESHIPGNVGAESLDYVVALENWIEKGQAPDVLMGHKLKAIQQMMGPMYLDKDLAPSNYLYSRPIYPYPIQARYKGKGDPDDASSFGPWNPGTKTWVK